MAASADALSKTAIAEDSHKTIDMITLYARVVNNLHFSLKTARSFLCLRTYEDHFHGVLFTSIEHVVQPTSDKHLGVSCGNKGDK